MARPVSNPRKAGLRIKINKEGYKTLVMLAHRVVSFMTANLNFVTPAPALATISTSAAALKVSMAQMGQKRSRGSKLDFQQAQSNAITLRDNLSALLNYVNGQALSVSAANTPAFAAIIAGSGFSMKDIRSINGVAQIPTFVRQTNNKKFPGNVHRINWKRPLGLIKGAKVAGYNISIGGVITQTVTKCNAIVPVAPGVNQVITITPFNSRGQGQSFAATVKGLS